MNANLNEGIPTSSKARHFGWRRLLVVGATVLLIVKVGSCILGVGKSVTFSRASGDSFLLQLRSSEETELGVAFKHDNSPYVRVLAVVDDGVLVGYVSGAGDTFSNLLSEYVEKLAALTGSSFDKIVHVSTSDDGYVDGAQLKGGIYVRDGKFTYEFDGGIKHSFESYSQVTDQDEILRFKEEIRRIQEEHAQAESVQKKVQEKQRIDDMRRLLRPELFAYNDKFFVQQSLDVLKPVRCPEIDDLVSAIKEDDWSRFEILAKQKRCPSGYEYDASDYQHLLFTGAGDWKIAEVEGVRYVDPWLIESHGADVKWISDQIRKGSACGSDVAIVSVGSGWFGCYKPTNVPMYSKRKLFVVKLETLLDYYASNKDNMMEKSFSEYLSTR